MDRPTNLQVATTFSLTFAMTKPIRYGLTLPKLQACLKNGISIRRLCGINVTVHQSCFGLLLAIRPRKLGGISAEPGVNSFKGDNPSKARTKAAVCFLAE